LFDKEQKELVKRKTRDNNASGNKEKNGQRFYEVKAMHREAEKKEERPGKKVHSYTKSEKLSQEELREWKQKKKKIKEGPTTKRGGTTCSS